MPRTARRGSMSNAWACTRASAPRPGRSARGARGGWAKASLTWGHPRGSAPASPAASRSAARRRAGGRGQGVGPEARATPGKAGYPWRPARSALLPGSIAAERGPQPGRGRCNGLRQATGPRRCGRTYGPRRAWQCSPRGARQSPTAGGSVTRPAGAPPRWRHQRRAWGARDGLGGPCATTRRALDAPCPAARGRGRRPPAPGQAVSAGRRSLAPEVWRRLTGREGAHGPGERALGPCRGQTRLARPRPGPAACLGVPRCPLADERPWEPQASRAACAQDAGARAHASRRPPPTGQAALVEPARTAPARVITAGRGLAASCHRGPGEAGMDA